MPIKEEGEGPRWKFRYDNFKTDPTPDILLLGQYRHPGTGNQLVGGINTHYLNKNQITALAKALPKIMQGNNLYRRYWIGRQLIPDIFNNFYRTYNAEYIRGVAADVMKPKTTFKQAAADWIKRNVSSLFKSKKRQKDDKPQYPSDLADMQTNLQNTMTNLASQKPQRPSEEPEDTPEMRKAREAFQQYQQDKAAETVKAAQPPDSIMGEIEQNVAPEEFDYIDDIDVDNDIDMRNEFYKEQEDNFKRNQKLDDLGESIIYFNPIQNKYVLERI
jgi:flagellar biosynthesis GTPase FlhF